MDMIIKSGEKYVTPERYASDRGISLATVYNMINDGRLEMTKAFKKTFVKQ